MTTNSIPAGVPVLERAQIEKALSSIDARAAMRSLFQALGRGRAVQPPQTLTLFPEGAGDFITYLGVLADAKVFGAKLSPYLVRPQGSLVTAWTLLMSMETGRPLLLCDSGALTVERTAATTALAVEYLAPADASVCAVVGVGALGRAHLRHVAPLRKWKEIRAHSRGIAERPQAREELSALDGRVRVVSDLNAAVEGADVILLCTSSGTSVLDPRTLKRPALITSISTNVADAHEVPPETLASMDVYCDYRQVTPKSAGEMKLAAARSGWSAESIVSDLAELAGGSGKLPGYGRHAFFRSIGLGLEDVAMAHALLGTGGRS
jgi:L-arginine dehydrogenase